MVPPKREIRNEFIAHGIDSFLRPFGLHNVGRRWEMEQTSLIGSKSYETAKIATAIESVVPEVTTATTDREAIAARSVTTDQAIETSETVAGIAMSVIVKFEGGLLHEIPIDMLVVDAEADLMRSEEAQDIVHGVVCGTCELERMQAPLAQVFWLLP